MKYLFIILCLFTIGCAEENKKVHSIKGEYYDGVGTIDDQNILFINVTVYPADESIGVLYTTQEAAYDCRYYKFKDHTYVSTPTDLTVVDLYNNQFTATSEVTPGYGFNPCKKVFITTNFVKN